MAEWSAISESDLGPYTDVDPLAPRDSGDVLDHTPRVPSVQLARTSPPQRGRVLGGRYRLGRSLGVGGYGAVFAALDMHSGIQVAVKVLSPAVSQSSEMLTRFHREAIAASRIRHPNIVDVLDFDVDSDGTHFIALEFLDGHDLADRLSSSGRLEPAAALTIAAQCAHGLAAAHRVGVLHRDLKPANVFLVRGDGGERVKVIDFGISKLTRLAGDYTDVTSASQLVGTPRYMSPEHARGDELDGRADVYSLGVMLFEMLTGEPPFVGRSALELFGRSLRARRPPPSTHVPDLGACPGLDALVIKALAAERNARFASMDDFAEAIVACLRAIAPTAADDVTDYSGEVSGPRPAARPPHARLVRRYAPSLIVLAAAVVLAGILATRDGATPSSRVTSTPPPAPPSLQPPPAPSPAPSPAPDAGVDTSVLPPPSAPTTSTRDRVDRRRPRDVARKRVRNAAQLGVAEW